MRRKAFAGIARVPSQARNIRACVITWEGDCGELAKRRRLLVAQEAIPAGNAEAARERRAGSRACRLAPSAAKRAQRLAADRAGKTRRCPAARRMAGTPRRSRARRADAHDPVLPWRRLLLLLARISPCARLRARRALRSADVFARLSARARTSVSGGARRCVGSLPAIACRRHGRGVDRHRWRFGRRRCVWWKRGYG